MNHPPIPDGPRFRTHKYTGGDGVTGTVNQFLCGDNVWRCIVELKAYDAKHGTHYAEDCVAVAMASLLREADRLWLKYTGTPRNGQSVLPILSGCNAANPPEDFEEWAPLRQDDWFAGQARAVYMSRIEDGHRQEVLRFAFEQAAAWAAWGKEG